MNNENLKCPCMPQCPHYEKCRQCIAAHASYYTVPHCIKMMQLEMKKNHIHPSNPHIKKSLPERIGEYYQNNPDVHLRSVAEALKITQWQLLDGMENAVSVPKEDFEKLYSQLQSLDKVMLHIDNGAVLIQIKTKLPQLLCRNDVQIVVKNTDQIDITSLIFANNFYDIFLVRETLAGGKESLSAAFVDEDEKIALSVYLCRTQENIIEKQSKDLFEKLWVKYKTNN